MESRDAGEQVLHLMAEIERLRAALRECGANWRSSPGTIMSAAREAAVEFQRRMQIANDALADEQKPNACPHGISDWRRCSTCNSD